jgi:hypothetical protein
MLAASVPRRPQLHLKELSGCRGKPILHARPNPPLPRSGGNAPIGCEPIRVTGVEVGVPDLHPVPARPARVDAAGAPPRRTSPPLLAGQMAADYIRAVPAIDLPADELAAVAAAIRGLIEDDKYPHAPRLDPLRAALARFDAAANIRADADPKVPPPAKADKRARR